MTGAGRSGRVIPIIINGPSGCLSGLFKHWFNKRPEKAEPIETLIAEFENNGNSAIDAAQSECIDFTASQWKALNEKEQQLILLKLQTGILCRYNGELVPGTREPSLQMMK
jgi:hypothetical protein